MSNSSADPGLVQALVEQRRARILVAISRSPIPVTGPDEPLPSDRSEHLLREAEELYWNELAWEELTDEELVPGGHLTELVFPGFLAFIDALLLDEVSSRSSLPARPHPAVVEEVLSFLSERYTLLTADLEAGADSERLVWARAMTAGLIDLVLYRVYRITEAEREQIEAGA